MQVRMAGGLVATLCIGALAATSSAQETGETQKLRQLFAQRGEQVQQMQVAQNRIEALSDQRDDLIVELRALNDEIERRKKYNEQIQTLIQSQDAEAASLRRQIATVTGFERDVLPLMAEMLETLEQFVEADVPFLLEERRIRVATLKEIMNRNDVTSGEKYRRLLEAYQIENDYGRTISAYEAKTTIGGQELEVEFLRIGRLALFYRTLDGESQGRWDKSSGTWQELSSSFRSGLISGLRIAKKQGAPDLIVLPVDAPQAAAQ